MSCTEVTLIGFPCSQLCVECDNGDPVTLIKSDSSSEYLCYARSKENNGITCPERKVDGKSKPELTNKD